MKLILDATIANDSQNDSAFPVTWKVKVDLPKDLTDILASSVMIMSVIQDAAGRIQEELNKHGRS